MITHPKLRFRKVSNIIHVITYKSIKGNVKNYYEPVSIIL